MTALPGTLAQEGAAHRCPFPGCRATLTGVTGFPMLSAHDGLYRHYRLVHGKELALDCTPNCAGLSHPTFATRGH